MKSSAFVGSAVLTVCAALKVGVLGDHKPSAWDKGTPCLSGSDVDLINCNLKVFNVTASEAAAQGVELLIFPEAYALAPELSPTSFSEPLVGTLGGVPCATTSAVTSPQQVALSCMAHTHAMPIAANVFTTLPNGTRHITELVYDDAGAVLAVYHKHHLFPTESKSVQPGPFAPTTFQLHGRKWGLIICYEGVYPDATGDWSQMDALKQMGAEGFVWSVGSTIPVGTASKQLAKKFDVSVGTSIDGSLIDSAGAVVAADGKPSVYVDTPLAGLTTMGYSAKALLRVGTLA